MGLKLQLLQAIYLYPVIRINQIYKSRLNRDYRIVVTGKKDAKWLCKVLTDRHGVYNGSHRMAERTLDKRFELEQ